MLAGMDESILKRSFNMRSVKLSKLFYDRPDLHKIGAGTGDDIEFHVRA